MALNVCDQINPLFCPTEDRFLFIYLLHFCFTHSTSTHRVLEHSAPEVLGVWGVLRWVADSPPPPSTTCHPLAAQGSSQMSAVDWPLNVDWVYCLNRDKWLPHHMLSTCLCGVSGTLHLLSIVVTVNQPGTLQNWWVSQSWGAVGSLCNFFDKWDHWRWRLVTTTFCQPHTVWNTFHQNFTCRDTTSDCRLGKHSCSWVHFQEQRLLTLRAWWTGWAWDIGMKYPPQNL